MSKLVCIKTFPNRTEAEFAKSVLEENGIKASVSVDDVGGMYPPLAPGRGAKLFVLDENAQKALDLLQVSPE